MTRLVLPILLLVMLAASVGSAADSDLIGQGSALYDEAIAAVADDPTRARALFAQAAAAFDQAAGQTAAPAAELYRAAGNAHVLAGEPGRAVLAFRRALHRDPSNRRAADGLAAARASINLEAPPSRTRHWLEVVNLWPRYVPAWTMQTLFMADWAAFWLVWLIARVRHRVPPLATLTILGIVAAASGSALLAHEWQERHARDVVITERAVGYNGPSADVYLPTFETALQPGIEGTLLETRGDWSQVELRTGARTWLPTTAVKRVVPESE